MLVAHLPTDSDTGRAHLGEAADWSRTDHLLAGVFDALRVLIWQNENQGRKSHTKRPRPLPRPGFTDTEATHYGTPMPLSEVKAMLAASAPGAGAEEVSADGG